MGIIKATAAAIKGAAADQWKEAFVAPEMGSDLLMSRAHKMAGANSGNEGSSEIITDGSVIIVGEGECAIATEGGKVIGVYDQPGEQIFHSGESKGIFSGGLGAFTKDVGRRIGFGGDAAILQRIYYINLKELIGGRINAPDLPLRYKDPVTGLDIDGGVGIRGAYTFCIADPKRFYETAIRSTDGRTCTALLPQMDREVLSALGPALAQMTANGIRPSELPRHTPELCQTLRLVMSDKWSGLRGLEVRSVAIDSIELLDAAALRRAQRDAMLRDSQVAGAFLAGAAADSLRTTAANDANRSSMVASLLRSEPGVLSGWKCACGKNNDGKFCTDCGARKPSFAACRCAGCGWTVPDGEKMPSFCPECGERFGRR